MVKDQDFRDSSRGMWNTEKLPETYGPSAVLWEASEATEMLPEACGGSETVPEARRAAETIPEACGAPETPLVAYEGIQETAEPFIYSYSVCVVFSHDKTVL